MIEDYVTKSNFIEGLRDLSHINEDYITKQKIIAMGLILEKGILDKVPGNTNRIVTEFYEHVQQHYVEREDLSVHVFYFLHQLFTYLNHNPDQLMEHKYAKKLSIHTKDKLELTLFCTQIFPHLAHFIKHYSKESNPQFRLRGSEALGAVLSPFLEKSKFLLD